MRNFNYFNLLIFSRVFSVPLDYPIVKREHFNRHYSSFAYYLAFHISDAPLLIFCSVLYSMITYYATGQPLEETRVLLFVTLGCLTCFAAQIFGVFCGSMSNVLVSISADSSKFKLFRIKNLNLQMTIVISIPIMIWHIIFAGVLILQKDSLPLLKWCFDVDFMKHTIDGMLVRIRILIFFNKSIKEIFDRSLFSDGIVKNYNAMSFIAIFNGRKIF